MIPRQRRVRYATLYGRSTVRTTIPPRSVSGFPTAGSHSPTLSPCITTGPYRTLIRWGSLDPLSRVHSTVNPRALTREHTATNGVSRGFAGGERRAARAERAPRAPPDERTASSRAKRARARQSEALPANGVSREQRAAGAVVFPQVFATERFRACGAEPEGVKSGCSRK
jgi:hypothetical protein